MGLTGLFGLIGLSKTYESTLLYSVLQRPSTPHSAIQRPSKLPDGQCQYRPLFQSFGFQRRAKGVGDVNRSYPFRENAFAVHFGFRS